MSRTPRLAACETLSAGQAKLMARRLRFVREHDAQVCKVDAQTWQAHIWQGQDEYTINGEDLEDVLEMAEVLTGSGPPGG